MADDLLDVHDGEMSMDLATPLFPTPVLLSSSPLSPFPSQPQSRPRSRSQTITPLNPPTSSDDSSPRMIRPRVLSSPLPNTLVPRFPSPPIGLPPPHTSTPVFPPGSQFIAPSPPQPLPRPDRSPPQTRSVSTTDGGAQTNLERIERALAEEQLKLREGEQQLEQLQHVLQGLILAKDA